MKFSIIVPTLNCENTIERLLDSLVAQENQDTFEMEVILCDDGSTDKTESRTAAYENKLNIIHCKQDKFETHCPGNTRIVGLDYATGDWVLFIDHDDYLSVDAFSKIKEIIDKEDFDAKMIYTKRATFSDLENEKEDQIYTSYVHGKFYNLEFIKENNINFKENLFGHEDLFFNDLCECVCIEKEYNWIVEDFVTYHWYASSTTTSGTIEEDNTDYFERTAKDYADALIEPFLSRENKSTYHMCKCIDALMYLYCYYEKYHYRALIDFKDEHRMDYFKDYIFSYAKEIEKSFELSADEIIELMFKSNEFYYLVNDAVQRDSIGHVYEFRGYIPTITLKDFLKEAFNSNSENESSIETIIVEPEDVEVIE